MVRFLRQWFQNPPETTENITPEGEEMIKSSKSLAPLNRYLKPDEDTPTPPINGSADNSGQSRLSPENLEQKIVENIKPAYHGWVAAVGFWQSVSSKEMLQRTEEEIHLWDEFRVSMIPLDIPRELEPCIMVAECSKIGIKVDLKTLEVKPDASSTMSDDRTKGMSSIEMTSEKNKRGNGRYSATA